MEDLDESQQQEILESISAEDRADIETALSYPENSAGRLMQDEFVSIPSSWTIERIKKHLQSGKNIPERFYEIYCVSRDKKVLGSIALSSILQIGDDIKAQTIMTPPPYRISPMIDQEEVAQAFRHYHLVSAPVVDNQERIVGMITIDDVVEVIDEEAEAEILHMARVGESDFHDTVLNTSLTRIKWLAVTFINTLLGSSVISQFQMSIEKKVALAVLMPIVAAMGGNSGMQVVTVNVRALATGDLRPFNHVKQLLKEVQVGFLNGLFFAGLMGTLAALWFQDNKLGLVLGSAMVFNMTWSGFAGTLLPIMVEHFKKDPALSAGPMLTTTTDVLGFAVFLGLSTFFLL
jgi:magnesium transporter